jgi:D-alanyl-D-alanine carboxypeptidase
MVRLVALGLLFAALGACGGATTDHEALLDEVVRTGSPGALGLVITPDGSWRGASGLADAERGTPMRPDARFRVGSVTKTFVAVVVLQLVAEGRLSLDAHVLGKVRVRDLLAHTSGIHDLTALPDVMGRHWEPQELVEAALREPRLFRTPGARFAYSSTNYVLLGLLVERTTGRTLEEEIAARVLRPLGLRHTGFRLAPGDVHGYMPPVRDGFVMARPGRDTWADDSSWAWASGNLVSTAADLARFYAALLRGELLPRRLLVAMATPAVERPNRLRYGLGIAIVRTECGLAYGHTGNVLGYVTAVWNDREASRQVVLMANAFPLGPEGDRTLRSALERSFCSDS